MKLVTQRELIRQVAMAWRVQYFSRHNGPYPAGHENRVVLERLEALDPETATAAAVSAIIGNDSWINSMCSGCGRFVPDVVDLGEDAVGDIRLCRECCEKAAALWEAKDEDAPREGA